MCYFQVAYIIGHLIVIVEHYSFIIYTLIKVDNLVADDAEYTEDNYKRYNCLITNCTQFRPKMPLLNDLGRFPWFKLCNPQFASLFNPFIGCEFLGLIALSFQYYLLLLACIVIPLQLYYQPMAPELFTLQIAPQLVLLDTNNCIKNCLKSVYQSFKCFCIASDDNRIQKYHSATSIDMTHSSFANEEHSIEILKSDYNSLCPNTQAFIKDTLPLIRTYKYQSIARGLFAYRYMVLVLNFMFALTAGIFVSIIKIQERRRVYKQIKDYTRLSGCKINTEDGSELDLDYIIDDWSPIFLIEFAITFLPMMLNISLLALIELIAVEELHIMHVEQIDRIKLILHVSKMLKQYPSGANGISTNGFKVEARSGDFELGTIRRYHEENLKNILGTFTYLKPLNDIDVIKIAIDSLVENGVSLDVYLNLLTKIYVGNRYLLDYMKSCEKTFNLLVTYCYAVTYALALAYIFYGHKLRQSDDGAALLSAFALLIANALVSYIRRIQSSTMKLIRSMWSVIAEIEHFKDIRIKHMRLLWTRQAIILLADGVIVLRAFGIPVTHANITEILLWSSIIAVYLNY